MAEKKVRVPNIGDFSDVEVIEVHIKAGDTVAAEDALITLETEKAAMDVPSPAAGKVVSVLVKTGDKVSEGSDICLLEGEAESETGEKAEGETGRETEEPAKAQKQTPEKAERPAAEAKPEEEKKPGGAPVREDVTVPDIGDFSDVDVIEVHIKPGDELAAEDALITLETEKAAMDVPAPRAGKVLEVHVREGDKVSRGDRIVTLETAGEEEGAQPAEAAKEPKAEEPAAKAPEKPAGERPPAERPAARGVTGLPPIDEQAFSKAHASPSVRKLARELGVDLARVTGSGRKSRVIADDVKAFVKSILSGAAPGAPSALPRLPQVDFAKFGEIETEPLGRIRKIAAPRLQASWINLPHVTQFDEADISDMEELRKSLKSNADERGIKLTPLAFIMRACAKALKDFPRFNASLDASGENIVFKKYMHIGFAADTEQGLLVPVVRDADKKDIYELAASLGELAGKARAGKLKADEMQGGSFTISSLGGIGGTAFTPIINAPEVAILGVSRSRMTPVYRDRGFVPRLMLPLSLSYDHRVIDGAEAARFTRALAEALEDAPALVQAIP
ncbi:MAG: dihydrolipoyllysine-residue acetyltransferase [Gammaproteobacteria bacterium]